MNRLVARLGIACALAWAGASAVLSNQDNFWLGWDQMPNMFKYGVGGLGLLLTKWIPNFSIGTKGGSFLPSVNFKALGQNLRAGAFKASGLVLPAFVISAIPFVANVVQSIVQTHSLPSGAIEKAVWAITTLVGTGFFRGYGHEYNWGKMSTEKVLTAKRYQKEYVPTPEPTALKGGSFKMGPDGSMTPDLRSQIRDIVERAGLRGVRHNESYVISFRAADDAGNTKWVGMRVRLDGQIEKD